MKLLKLMLFVMLAISLSACMSTTPVALHGAKPEQRQENAVIAGGNIYKVKELRWGYYTYAYLVVKAINGKSVGSAVDFVVPPGKYKVSTLLSTPGDDSTTIRQTAVVLNFEHEIEVRAGHTYIPERIGSGDNTRVEFVDAGPDFRRECLPTMINAREINGDKSVQCEKR